MLFRSGARAAFDSSIVLTRTNYYSLLNRGVIYLNYDANNLNANNAVEKEKYLKLSILDFDNALRLTTSNTDRVNLYNNIGIAKFFLGDFAGALNYADSAIAVDAGNAQSYILKGNARFSLGDYEAAFEDFNKATEINPQDANAIKGRDAVKSILESEKKQSGKR